MLSHADLVAFLPTTDPGRAETFFGGVLGLTLLEASPFALLFDAGGTPLRVTPVEEIRPADYTVLGWQVADVTATVESLAARGVAFARFDGLAQDALGIWDAPGGARVAWFRDPDHNLLSVTQPAPPSPASQP